MDAVKFFSVSVKIEREDDSTDKLKIKKSKEEWLVSADNAEKANNIVKDMYKGSEFEWRIAKVQETAYLGVLNYSENKSKQDYESGGDEYEVDDDYLDAIK